MVFRTNWNDVEILDAKSKELKHKNSDGKSIPDSMKKINELGTKFAESLDAKSIYWADERLETEASFCAAVGNSSEKANTLANDYLNAALGFCRCCHC